MDHNTITSIDFKGANRKTVMKYQEVIQSLYYSGNLDKLLENLDMSEKQLLGVLYECFPKLKHVKYIRAKDLPPIPLIGSLWEEYISDAKVELSLDAVAYSEVPKADPVMHMLSGDILAAYLKGKKDLAKAISTGWDIHLGYMMGWSLHRSRKEILMMHVATLVLEA